MRYHVRGRVCWGEITCNRDTTQSCVTWLLYIDQWFATKISSGRVSANAESAEVIWRCDMTHVTWLIHVWHDYLTRLLHVWHDSFTCDLTFPYECKSVRLESVICDQMAAMPWCVCVCVCECVCVCGTRRESIRISMYSNQVAWLIHTWLDTLIRM